MAVPKTKTSNSRRDKRRSSVWKLKAPALVKCDHCGELKRLHRVCGSCGYYKNREIVKMDEK
ncbi:MAG: 50S ribosomal protein L32 [Oscillospiraceae bacterium]|nr:50S ribosomal protein L32 [Oscillospiraceae bacterium]